MLALIAHLFSLAVLFLLLTSAFVAAAQVVVYAGAVMVLYVFVVAYVGERPSRPGSRSPASDSSPPLLGFVLFVELSVAVLSSALKALGTHGPDVPAGFGDPAAIGTLLLEKFLRPLRGLARSCCSSPRSARSSSPIANARTRARAAAAGRREANAA